MPAVVGDQPCADRQAALVGGESRGQRPLQVPGGGESRGLAYPWAGLAADLFSRQRISGGQSAPTCEAACELLTPVPPAVAISWRRIFGISSRASDSSHHGLPGDALRLRRICGARRQNRVPRGDRVAGVEHFVVVDVGPDRVDRERVGKSHNQVAEDFRRVNLGCCFDRLRLLAGINVAAAEVIVGDLKSLGSASDHRDGSSTVARGGIPDRQTSCCR
jgi:hypothetical protein